MSCDLLIEHRGLSDGLSAWWSQPEVKRGMINGTVAGIAASTLLQSCYPNYLKLNACAGSLVGTLTYVGTVIAHELNRGTQSDQNYAASSGPTTLEQDYQGGGTAKED